MSDAKAGNESESQPRPRIESLSDMIFGLALSVGAITLVGNPPKNGADLTNDILTFGFSFLILITVWMRYTRIMSVLPLENRMSISLNTVLLFTVSIEPFLFDLVKSGGSSGTSPGFANIVSIYYAIDLGIMVLILGFFTSLIIDEKRKVLSESVLQNFKFESIGFYVSAAFFIFSTLIPLSVPGIGGVSLRYEIWLVPFMTATARRRGFGAAKVIKKHRSGSGEQDSGK